MYLMNIPKHNVICALLLTFASLYSLAASNDEQKQIKIAVVKIQANNCPESIGSAVQELLISRLYATSVFILMEKSQMDRIAQKNGFTDFDTTDTELISRLGKVLDVEKIIVGSVNKIGNYRLELRAIDIATNSIDITVPLIAENEKELNKAIDKAVSKIERYYLGYDQISGNASLSITPSIIYPFGSYGNGIGFGYGATFSATRNNVITDNVCATVLLGAYTLQPNHDNIKSFYMFPLEVTGGYSFDFSKTLSVTPSFGVGALFTMLRYDEDGNMLNGKYQYVSDNYINLLLDARVDFSFFVYNRLSMSVAPSFRIVPGYKYSVIPALDCGVKLTF